MKFHVIHRRPTTTEYNELRRSVSWPTYDDLVVAKGLENTLFAIVVEDDHGIAVGMGRILGDDAIYLHIQDVIVRPEFQGKGIGKLVMEALQDYVDRTASKNTNVGLMCSKGREPFYRSFGFIDRPTEKFGSGMIKIM